MDGSLNPASLTEYRDAFYASSKTRLAQNMVSRGDPLEACLQRKCLETSSHVFSHKVEETKPMTSQQGSGRCWLFACLNAMRIPFVKEKNLEDFEFSQAHLFFWDKVERSNYFLNAIVDCHRRCPKESVDGRLVSFLLSQPISDGGQWDMVVNLMEKHGVMPKKCYPETWSCTSSSRMNGILKSKLREFAYVIHKQMDAGLDKAGVNKLVSEQMKTIYRIVGICLGVPPTQFTWEYYDKSKKSHKLGPITPLQFYRDHVQPVFNAQSKVCLVTDPRPENPPGRTYSVDCLGNVVGGRNTIYNNQPVDALLNIAAKSIMAGEPVWFGCEVGKCMVSKQGYLDLNAHDYDLVFDTNVNLNLSKANRLIYGDSAMSHAMVLTGVHIEGDKDNVSSNSSEVGEPIRWRVENSWGEDRHDKGYLVMSSDWFREFVFEIVVDKKFCTQDVLDAYKTEPKILPAWDPMGALAKTCN